MLAFVVGLENSGSMEPGIHPAFRTIRYNPYVAVYYLINSTKE